MVEEEEEPEPEEEPDLDDKMPTFVESVSKKRSAQSASEGDITVFNITHLCTYWHTGVCAVLVKLISYDIEKIAMLLREPPEGASAC